ncbi:MAG TPA: hypothetical protein VK254_01710 [Candidatus Bathyarchaeia archaeon]|nr:hypothetical protein [Candidatus Bathyarchaeia archaeon]
MTNIIKWLNNEKNDATVMQLAAFWFMGWSTVGRFFFKAIVGFSPPLVHVHFAEGILSLMAMMFFALHTGKEGSRLSFIMMGVNFLFAIVGFALAIWGN